MERLSHMILKEVQNNNWTLVQFSANGPRISHLFFADDVLLFTKAKPAQARLVSNVLQRFCAISGLNVSLEKSRIYASKGVTAIRKEKITRLTNIQFTNRLGKYLGLKIFHGRPRKEDFEDVLERVSSKLASWKGRLLNKPGRWTLTNAVLNAIPSYGMQVQWLPQTVCDTLDRTSRHLIWKGTGDKGVHMLRWSAITQPKKLGGLGVCIARHQNTALLGKLVWDVMQNSNKLWVKVITAKYIEEGTLFQANHKRGSPTWNSLVKAFTCLKEGFSMKFGDGHTSFWHDVGLFQQPLCELVPMVDIHDLELRVCDVWAREKWDWDRLYTPIPPLIAQRLATIRPLLVEGIKDVWVWHGCTSGSYSTKTAYWWLLPVDDCSGCEHWA